MKASVFSRVWHRRLGVILGVPFLLVGATAVLIAHGGRLGLKDIPVAAEWLPGYAARPAAQGTSDKGGDGHPAAGGTGGAKAAPPSGPGELRGALVTRDGRQWLAAKGGVFELQGARAVRVEALPAQEFRQLAETPAGLLAAGKKGLYRQTGSDWEQLTDGEVWSINPGGNGEFIAVLKSGELLRLGADLKALTPEVTFADAAQAAAAALPPEPLHLGKLILDLHTGKAFFSKRWEWIWIDLLGLVCIFLGITGIYLWSYAKVKKAGKGGREAGAGSAARAPAARHAIENGPAA